MVNDLLDISNDVIHYKTVNDHGIEQEKEVLLDEGDTMWTEFRHRHIADCMRSIPERFKNFAKEKRHKTSNEQVWVKYKCGNTTFIKTY